MEQDSQQSQSASPPAYLADRHLPAPIRTSRNGPAVQPTAAAAAAPPPQAPSLFGGGFGGGAPLLALASPPYKQNYLAELASSYAATYRCAAARAAAGAGHRPARLRR
jgi:hypothetical protein